ncbi:exonuclease domain-containing protein [Glutamicibacter sp.]|uniref:exonuclease domain-containing protein n=1 Tax=Glutamicibacter sp. TaxID=1931995 RepID=UPI0028BE508A|nr:exonuclease domain-containing protein [Glutamicibacter sp.]
MALDFTAVDFETANGFIGSACSVGLVKVRSGRIVETDQWLMKPPVGFDHFDPRNVSIHHITPDMVADSPRVNDRLDDLMGFVGSDVLVAHNSAFDSGVIRAASEASERAINEIAHLCTVKLARKAYDLPSYSLPFVAEEAGHPIENHHEALADSTACAWAMIDMAERAGSSTVLQAADHYKVGLGLTRAWKPGDELSRATKDAQGWRAAGHKLPAQDAFGNWPQEGPNPEPNLDADPSHPLFGQVLVFTGNLGMPRPQAKMLAAQHGALTASRVTRATTALVVGDGFIPQDLANGRLTNKAKHVLRLREKGQKVTIISEGEFMQLVGGFSLTA